MIEDKGIHLPNCPVCQRPFKKVRAWQEVCSSVCRRKKWQLKAIKRILDQAYSIAYAELEGKIKAGFRL